MEWVIDRVLCWTYFSLRVNLQNSYVTKSVAYNVIHVCDMLSTYYATYKRINIFKQEHVNWSLKNIIMLYPKLVKDRFAFVFSSSRFPIGCLTFRYFRHYDQKSISRIVVDIKLLFSFFNCLNIILTVL